MKKFLSIVLSILMVVTMLPMAVLPASAASTPTPYDGVPVTPQKISSSNYAKLGLTSSNWSQFNGYYAIRNAKELYGFAAVSRSSSTANAVLLQDIVVNANGGTTYNWTPIAHQSNEHAYEGIFDGNGHYISGLYSTTAITRPGRNYSDCGFICNLYGTVKNLVIKNSTFAPGIDIGVNGGLGAITGYPYGCTIQNCRVENITLKSINDGGQLGGIAGYGNGGSSTIKNCVSINVTFSGGNVTDPIAPKAPYSSCYTSATASHNCTNLSVEHKEVKATCEYPGLSNYKYCLVCGKVTSGTKTETPATGHTLKSATCVAPKTCTICGATEGSIDNTAHNWANNDGICANGCGATCAHKNQTGSACEICGAELHVCSNYNNGFCTECDAYEPAELKDGYYQIENGGQLFWYANYINTVDRTANAVLTADIDLENRPWTPIGSTGENNNNFRGIFDGQNYFIRGLYVEGGRAGLGFFGEVRTGTVKNFTIYGEVVVNTEVDYIGGVIGSVCGLNGENDLERNGAIIQNIRSFVNLTAKAHGIGMIGGFVGYANHQSLIENCSWYGTFDAGVYRVDSGAGGFIGKIQENSSEVTIRNCAAYGTIKTNYAGDYNDTATIYMGGFLSFTNTNAKTTLENCLFAGQFERGDNLTDEAFLGAFGTLRSVNAIKNCYYLGDDGLEAVHSDSNLKPGSDNVEITKVTAEQLKSGEIAYKLQEANEIWGQSIGTDAYPVLGGEEVYYGYVSCDDEAMVYTNDSTVSDTKPDHAWGDSVLTRPTKTQDGYYTYTCSACGETKTEPAERAANYDDYTKALEDLRSYLDSDMLTDENKSYISEWLATYDTDEAYGCIAGEEETVQMYIDATAQYVTDIETCIQNCLAGNHSGNGDYCEICGTTLHTCDFSGEWKYDTDKHWKECTAEYCIKISEEAEHSYVNGKCSCGYACPHDSYTDGVCDNCDYECAHAWDEGVLTRPVYDAVLGSKDGYYTYSCTLCGDEKKETVKSADYAAYEAVAEEINALLQSDELTDAAKQAIYSAANECGLPSNDLTESEQNIVDDLVAELEKIVADAEEKIASGEYVKINGLEEIVKIKDKLIEDLTEKYGEEALAEITDKIGYKYDEKFDELYEKAEALTGSVAENKEALEEIEAEMEAIFAELEKCLAGTHSFTDYEIVRSADCVNNAWELGSCSVCGETDEREIPDSAYGHNPAWWWETTATEHYKHCINDSCADEIEGTRGQHVYENYEITKAAACGANAEETGTCICGMTHTREVEGTALTHSFTKYEVTEEAECGKAGKEVAYCDHGCGATDEKEIPALTHKDDDGDYLCDHGCGHEFPKPVEPEQPDTPDTPDEPTDDTCDHICHSNNALMKILWKIISFFYRLFNIQQYCDCGELHYDAPIFG